ncbi:MAG: hypothetical protein R2744_08470 [Bacteroidales bacterium]
MVGLLSALAAVLLKNTIHYTEILLNRWSEGRSYSYLYFAWPLFGMFLTVLCKNMW